MRFYLDDAQLQPLEDGLQQASAQERGARLVELAWHLRQRDSARALVLLAEADGLAPPMALDLQARAALTACEVATLFCRLDAAEAHLSRAKSLLAGGTRAQGGLDYAALGDAQLAEALLAKVQVQHQREQHALQASIALFSQSGDAQRQAIAKAWQGYELAFTQASSSLALDRPADTAALAWWTAAQALAQSRRVPAEAAELFLQASDLARASGQLRLTIICTINSASTVQGLGDFDEASSRFSNALMLANRCAWPILVGASKTGVGRLLRELGQLGESRAVLMEAQLALGAAPAGHNAANASGELAQTLLAAGQAAEAVGPIAEAMSIYRRGGAGGSIALNLIFQARILSAAGQPDAALAALAESEALIEKLCLPAIRVAVNDALAEVHRRYPKMLPPPGMSAPNAAIHYAEATLQSGAMIDSWQAPAVLYIALADDWEAAGNIARAYDYARKALAAKAREATLTLAHPLAVLRLRLQQDLEGDDGEEAELQDPVTPVASEKLLTPKEREILALLARNYSNKEIANALLVSSETVKWHLKALYTKLEAASRKHAVTRARTLGMLGRT
ncbi:helix-turn-helix transcriptional regulator [Paucibacter sp. B2R-40]|uniref:helix-turn-helix domain-containing protein n=1 Tax=Paucibacter sp. B2R-40 TaxID=2893554 RepID=UPI0021E46BD5|nr:helix-turn-helix transcriptional regulator [Paucibacter sp. B2R-40]